MINAQRAAAEFVNSLDNDDIVSIVIYDDEITTLVEPREVGRRRGSITKAIYSFSARNSTNLCEGLMAGIRNVICNFNGDRVNRVILLSDGLANIGITNTSAIIQRAREVIGERRISISTLGVGADYNESLMQAIAESFKGAFYNIENAEFIGSIVSRELTGLQSVIWKNVEIEFQSPSSIHIDKVYGYEANGAKSYIGDVRALDELYVIAKCFIPKEIGYGIINAIIRYDNVARRCKGMEVICQFRVETTDSPAKVEENIEILTNMELFHLGTYVDEISKLMNSSNFKQAAELAQTKINRLNDLNRKNPSDQRIGIKLAFLQRMLTEARNRTYTKKFAKQSSYYSYSSSRANYRKKISSKYGRSS